VNVQTFNWRARVMVPWCHQAPEQYSAAVAAAAAEVWMSKLSTGQRVMGPLVSSST
jgi:hypothetical protein